MDTNKYKRRLFILKQIYMKKKISLDELFNLCTKGEEFAIASVDVIKRDCDGMSENYPVIVLGNEVIWKSEGLDSIFSKTMIGKRSKKNQASKQILAKCVIDLILGLDPQPEALMLATGSTVLNVFKEIINRFDSLSLNRIYTNNLWICAEAFYSRPSLHLQVPTGEIKLDPAAIISVEGIKSLGRADAEVFVTSFGGLIKEGFSSDEERDEKEKRMNVNPSEKNEKCKYIIIPISWDKIGKKDKIVVKKKQLDPSGRLNYKIVTDPPTHNRESNKLDILEYWKHPGVVEVIFA